jgi:hypothetical protein
MRALGFIQRSIAHDQHRHASSHAIMIDDEITRA